MAKENIHTVFGGSDNKKDTPKSIQKNVNDTNDHRFTYLKLPTIPINLAKPTITKAMLIKRSSNKLSMSRYTS